ncbi:MAG: hypothetical protein QOJ01_2367 [Solirubrobacterales bacterium]|nr:hypothetical protein [Solirubrobacterales bacterium]
MAVGGDSAHGLSCSFRNDIWVGRLTSRTGRLSGSLVSLWRRCLRSPAGLGRILRGKLANYPKSRRKSPRSICAGLVAPESAIVRSSSARNMRITVSTPVAPASAMPQM